MFIPVKASAPPAAVPVPIPTGLYIQPPHASGTHTRVSLQTITTIWIVNRFNGRDYWLRVPERDGGADLMRQQVLSLVDWLGKVARLTGSR
jgi:hypothetical protein